MSSSSNNDATIPLNTVIHMLTIKLSASNYLLWKNQMIPILSIQNLLSHVDGTGSIPDPTITVAEKSVENPAFSVWNVADQKTVIIIHASLSEEAVSVIVGLTTARSIWVALEAAYGNSSIERVHTLRDQLRLITKGAQTVSVYGRNFKALCDHLSAIGHPVDANDQFHWFLCGLGPTFENFSTSIRPTRPPPLFSDLLARAESHEMFLQTIHRSSTPAVAFSAAGSNQPMANRGRGSRGYRGGGYNGGRGRGRGRRPPHFQLCRTNGHYANECPKLPSFASQSSSGEDLAQAFMANCHVSNNIPDWYVDSGASDHMSSTSETLSNVTPTSGTSLVTFGNGQSLPVSHTGSSYLSNNIRLNDILVVPNLSKNLLSVSKLTKDNSVDVLLSHPNFFVQDRNTKQVLAQGRCENGLYVFHNHHEAFFAANKCPRASFELWHSRLGHSNVETLKLLQKSGHLSFNALLPKPVVCSFCQMAKSHKLSFQVNTKRALHPLDLIHCDVWGPSPVTSHDNYRYYIVFIDDFSRFSWLYPLARKSDVFMAIENFVNFAQTQFSQKIKVFQSDGGTEFVNHRVRELFHKNGTHHQFSCPYTPPQNARAERKHRHIIETGLAMMFNANVPTSYWVEAVTSAVFIINRMPSSVLKGKSPFELLYHRVPDFSIFRVFGCRVYPYLRHHASHKLAPRSIPCIFIGYSSTHKGFRCLDPITSRIYVSRHAQFDEMLFPFADSMSHNPVNSSTSLPITTFIDSFTIPRVTNPLPTPKPIPSPPPCTLCIDDPLSQPSSSTSTITENTTTVLPTEPTVMSPAPTVPVETNTHHMTTRAKAGIFKPRHIADLSQFQSPSFHVSLYAHTDPKTFNTAAKDSKWVDAMKLEINALYKNKTFHLVPRPSNRRIVRCKWLYRTKYRADGSIERYKARLVAQGYSQLAGLDYSHTFSPVVKATTIRVILSLAMIHDWKLHQLDVNNAFLHGNIDKDIFMEQPPGFVHPKYPNHVCKLDRALYGLKQAPRAWFQRLSSFLLANGFTSSRADTSLFIFKRDTHIIYMLVYVDDLIVTGNNEAQIAAFIDNLNKEFATKDLGPLNYFLGLEVSNLNSGLFLSQSKFATDILQRASMLEAKPVATPLSPSVSFTKDGEPLSDATHYRSLVGALQYLTITRPDISYAVNQVSQFLSAPTTEHFQHVKRILRYVKGTLSYGLTFTKQSVSTLMGFSDADWARCLETRRSTYGYSIFLGGNLVSWSAKKQPTVSRSSCESEYRAMANTAAELIWISHLLQELHALPASRPTLLCDNRSSIFLTQNPISHKRVKHIELDYHFLRELVLAGKLHTRFVPSKLQVADIFTKSLPRPQFEHFRTMLRIGPPPSRLRGDINHIS